MKRRTLVMRVGDHWFLRHVRDLYETLTSKYTTNDQPRGIVSVFPKHISSPFWFRHGETTNDYTHYFKDSESISAFKDEMDSETELKIYIAGHCGPRSNSLASLETNTALYFKIEVQAIARMVSETLRKIAVTPTPSQPVKISLIACSAASGGYDSSDSFAVKLLKELHSLGHNHILVKARKESVSAPIFGKKFTVGKKEHFYLADEAIYHVEKDNDLRKKVLKVIKQCHSTTKIKTKSDYLARCLQQMSALGYPGADNQKPALLKILDEARQSAEVKQFRYGTAWFMNLFGLKSNTETQLDKLRDKLTLMNVDGSPGRLALDREDASSAARLDIKSV